MKTSRFVILIGAVLITVLLTVVFSHEKVGISEQFRLATAPTTPAAYR